MTTLTTPEELDAILALQLSVAWAGEAAGEPRRLGWWQTDLIDAEGGGDLFARLVPRTAAWAGLALAREAARHVERAGLERIAARDRVWTLFHLGFEIDEQLADRLAYHRRHLHVPADVLGPELVAGGAWSAEGFAGRVSKGAAQGYEGTAAGRRLKGRSATPLSAVRGLAAALVPLQTEYPMPFVEAGGG